MMSCELLTSGCCCCCRCHRANVDSYIAIAASSDGSCHNAPACARDLGHHDDTNLISYQQRLDV